MVLLADAIWLLVTIPGTARGGTLLPASVSPRAAGRASGKNPTSR